MDNNIISNAPISDFDGVFRFTNPTDEDFVTLWNSIEYTFPARSTSPLIIQNETQEGIQNIRKVFARKLAEREFFNSSEYRRLIELGRGEGATYNQDETLKEMIQKCLEPLPPAKATMKVIEKPDDSRFEDKIEGISPNESLIEKARSKGSKNQAQI